MKDRYASKVRKNFLISSKKPLPGRLVDENSYLSKLYTVGSFSPPIYLVSISFDQFINCISNAMFRDLKGHICFQIYDEDIINSNEDLNSRAAIINYLNSFPNATFDFYLSDSTFPVYLDLMKNFNWRRDNVTSFEMSIDRNPTTMKNFHLNEAKGNICLSEEALLFFPDSSIKLSKGKIPSETYEATFRLRDIIGKYNELVDRHYDSKKMTDFDKAFLADHYLFDKKESNNISITPLEISYAYEQTMIDQEGCRILLPSKTRWESSPVGTYDHRKGVCTGQARLFNSLICNPTSSIPAIATTGTIPTGEEHCWSEFVIDGKTYQCCTTLRGLFNDLKQSGYIPHKKEGYQEVYPLSSLDSKEIEDIKKHLKSLKR